MHCLPIKTLLLALLLMALAEDISASKSMKCTSNIGNCMKAKKCKKTIEPMYKCPHKKHVCCVEDHTTSAPADTTPKGDLDSNIDNMETKLDTMMDLIKKLAGYMEMKLDNMEDKLDTKMDHIIELFGCWFGDNQYPIGFILKSECMELICENNRQWKFTGNYINNCGNCTVGGEPLVYTFDIEEGEPRPYQTNVTGEYVLTQPGLNYSPIPIPYFGVNGHFNHLNWDPRESCVHGVTYYEQPDIRITVYCPCVVGPTGKCVITVFPWSPSFSGAILYFTCSIGTTTVNCISIVGTEGLTVVVCETPSFGNQVDLPWAYIYALPLLESSPNSTLYGLCNTNTGQIQSPPAYIGSGGTRYATPDGPFVTSWKV